MDFLSEDNRKRIESEPARDAYWKEIDTDKKVERMRKVVKDLQYTVRRLSQRINRLEAHQHDNEGRAVTIERLQFCGVVDETYEKNTDEVYF